MLIRFFCDRCFIIRIFFHWWKKLWIIKRLSQKALLLFGFRVITTKYIWVLLVISDSQTEFSKQLTHSNSKTPFQFSFWFSNHLLHKLLQKLIFHSILLPLLLGPPPSSLSPIFYVGFDISDFLPEQKTFLEPTLATLSWRGEGRSYF